MKQVLRSKRDYSHRIVGIFNMTEPTEQAKKLGNWASLDAQQYFEQSTTGGAVPFRFIRGLLLYPDGGILYQCYMEALKVASNAILKLADEYQRRTNTIVDLQKMQNEPMRGSLEMTITVDIPRIFDGKPDVYVSFKVDGNSKEITDFDDVFRAKGLLIPVKLAEALRTPLAEASGSPQEFAPRKVGVESKESSGNAK